MSNWINVELDDIDFTSEGDEINILYSHDDLGNNYVTIKTADIFKKIQDRLEVRNES